MLALTPALSAGRGRPRPRFLFLLAVVCAYCATPLALSAARNDGWQNALAQMPIPSQIAELNRSNCVKVMLGAFQSNHVIKALIFMPGATDEFYMFRRAKAQLTNASPSLLDAVAALTNQTLIRVTFHSPFLLLHTDEDPLVPLSRVENESTAENLKVRRFVPQVLYNDRDWDFVQPILAKRLGVDVRPWKQSYDSWHFYRHSFAACDLNGWEALEVVALAGKSKFTVRWHKVVFEGDERVRATPKLDVFPR